MLGQVFITDRKGGVSCYPVRDFAELERRIDSAYRRRLVAVAYRSDPAEKEGRRVIGEVEKDPEGKWIYWHETENMR
jgi:hypothetical protein